MKCLDDWTRREKITDLTLLFFFFFFFPLIAGLEAWRLDRLGPEGRIVLLGHSFGGLISTHYTKRYPQHVIHLILAAPAGVKAPDQARIDRVWRSTWLRRYALHLWRSNVTLQAIVRSLPFGIGPMLCRYYVRTRWQAGGGKLDRETLRLVSEYAIGPVMLPGCSEKALNMCIQPISHSRTPIGPIVENELPASIPVDFITGEKDCFCSPLAATEVVQRMKAKGRTNVESHVLHNTVGA